MPTVDNLGIRIHYELHGSGHPVVLIHGGTVSFQHNYADFGWIETLNSIGLQVIGLDLRGHGNSGKPHDIASYGTSNLASDVVAVLDHLSLTRASLVAYSIGTAVALHLLQHAPERFDRAALIATGDGLIGQLPHTFANILPSLLEVLDRTAYPKDLPKHLATYWNFVAATGGDRQALRALAQASYAPLTTTDASAIKIPTLVMSGQADRVLGQAPKLAEALGQGSYIEVPGADHFSLAADPRVQAEVARFIQPEAAAR
ncbi:MAG: alpha/beta hydrolase [Burkholderiaceae bacterium]|nr:alpha/beta hydrolase [Burkholderiaceae bacterium]